MSEQERNLQDVFGNDESSDEPDVEAHRLDEAMRTDEAMREDLADERGRVDEAL